MIDATDGNVLCVDDAAPARTVEEALASGGHAIALVLDPEGHAIGIASRADLAHGAASALVRDRMTPFVITLLASATVADATRLILERGLHHVPLLCEGKVLGVVSAVGALRWYAQNMRSVVDTGLYAVVRHPMYLGGLVLIAGVPLALGSLVGLATFVPFAAVIVFRLLDEGRFLVGRLVGYRAYRDKVRFRLISYVW